MKVCVVNPNYYKSSGVTKVIRSIYHWMAENRDVDWLFVDCRYGTELSDVDWAPNLAVFNLMSLNPFVLIRDLFKFRLWLQRNKVDLIHIHHRRLAFLFSFAGVFFKQKFLYTGHLTYKSNKLFKWVMRMPSVSISRSVHENIIDTTSSSDVREFGNPVSFSLEVPGFTEDSFSTAVTIGRLSPVKGIDYIVRAFGELSARGVKHRLIVVGEGEMYESLEELALQLGIERTVDFVGYTDQVTKYIDQACFSILHSEVEGFGLVTVESAARGRASLVTNVDGSRDLVPINHKLPNLLQFGNVGELADAIEIWFQDREKLVKEGDVFRRYLNKYATENVVASYYDFYRELVYERG